MPNQDDVSTDTEYALDLAFSSAAQPFKSNLPIALAYGFAHSTSKNGWVSDGQDKETVLAGHDVYFSFFDTAEPTEATVSLTNISISFSKKGSPFCWSSLAIPPDEQPPPPQTTDWSAGCNVKGKFWRIGPYPAVNVTPPGVDGYNCTVEIKVTVGDQTKTYRVDPEMIIRGG